MSKPLKITLLIAIVVMSAALLALKRLPQTAITLPGGQPAATKVTQRAAAEPTQFAFDKTVSLSEELPVEIRFRDLSNLPADFSDYNEATKNAPTLKGAASFRVLSMEKTDSIGSGGSLGAGETYWVATYEFQGDSKNPKGAAIRPAAFQSAPPEMSPQLVLIDGDKVLAWSLDDSKTKAKADRTFWPNYASLYSDDRRTLVAVWKYETNVKPILALAYLAMDGKEHYIRINY